MSEIEWAAFHFIEDEKADQEDTTNRMNMLLSFINPEMFKAYHKATDAKNQIVNEDFERELKSRGISLEPAGSVTTDEGYSVEEVDPSIDIIG